MQFSDIRGSPHAHQYPDDVSFAIVISAAVCMTVSVLISLPLLQPKHWQTCIFTLSSPLFFFVGTLLEILPLYSLRLVPLPTIPLHVNFPRTEKDMFLAQSY